MRCKSCANVVDRLDVPHVIRRCPECGREMHIIEPGEHGRGIKVQKGDKFVIPQGFIRLSLNPLQSSGQLTKAGVDMMVRALLLDGLYPNETTFDDDTLRLEQYTDQILSTFAPLAGLDINNADHTEKIYSIMKEHELTREFWALWTGHFLAISRGARKANDAQKASWAAACAERCRSMLVFKEGMEDIIWMGQSVKRILNLLSIWNANKTNDDESFWQATFSDHSYALSQVFAVPVVFIQKKAYVGGTKLDGSESRFVDYLFSAESSCESILVEIKTPTTPLLSGKYRDISLPSRELSGSVVQVLNYRTELISNLQSLIKGSELKLTAFHPKCVLIVGNAKMQLLDEKSRKSFELFRGNQRNVEIITYDELFRKTEILAELFGLNVKHPVPKKPT